MKKSEQTRQRILDSFLELMASQRWERISVKALCEHCGITRSTFYLYFIDTADLIGQLQRSLLEEMDAALSRSARPAQPILTGRFLTDFDYAPPPELQAWFTFCRQNRRAVTALLCPDYGCREFRQAVADKLQFYISGTMDRDGMPRDALRAYLLPLCAELYILSAYSWLTDSADHFHSIYEVMHMVNAARVGSCYLSFKSLDDPQFESKMKFDFMVSCQ